MNVTRLAVLGLAAGAAVMAAVLAKGFLGQKPEKEVVEINKVAQTDVLVAAKDINVGDKLNAGNLVWQTWPEASIKPSMLTRATNPRAREEFESGRARVAMHEGDPVSERKVILPNTAGFMAALLPKGMRAVSVRIKEESAASGFILPNDRVDVILTTKGSEGSSSRSMSEPVLTNVKVLAIDQTFQTNDKGEQVVVGKTATLELDPEQAEVLTMVESTGQLTLALRSLADRGDSELGDDGPRLADRFAKGRRGGISVYKYGVHSTTGLSR